LIDYSQNLTHNGSQRLKIGGEEFNWRGLCRTGQKLWKTF
jgi:hypothetical protein